MKWKKIGHEYDFINDEVSKQDNVYTLWGFGVFGRAFYETMKSKVEIEGFCDSSPSKQGGGMTESLFYQLIMY